MTIPGMISSRIAETGESQAAFARRLGMTPQTLNQLVQGHIKLPTADIRRRLASELGVRHVDILVAAGELTADEIDPRRQATYGDNRLQAIADNWNQLTEKEKDFLLLILEGNRRRRGLDGLDDIVQVVTESGGRQSTG